MLAADLALKAAFLVRGGKTQEVANNSDKDSSDETTKTSQYLIYLGKADLPHQPVRVRHLPHSGHRFLFYGINGYQEMRPNSSPQCYALKTQSALVMVSDCAQTRDGDLFTVARSHSSALLIHYDKAMVRQKLAEIPYPLGCLSSMAADLTCRNLYGTNLDLNCIIKFTCDDIALNKAQRFGALWRPFDCCLSQEFRGPDGAGVQFLFVSNLDAGICAFNAATMQIVAECGDDLLPGAKYLAYDAKRSLLFVSCSCESLLRCYRFEAPASLLAAPARLRKVGDFLIANRKPNVRPCGPQCLMWDPETELLTVVSWSHVKGKFGSKFFRVSI